MPPHLSNVSFEGLGQTFVHYNILRLNHFVPMIIFLEVRVSSHKITVLMFQWIKQHYFQIIHTTEISNITVIVIWSNCHSKNHLLSM